MHGSLVEPLATAAPRRRLRLRTFESPVAFSRTCLRLAAVLAIAGAVGLLDRVWALCVVVLLLLLAALARMVDLDGLVAEPEPLAQPDVADAEPELVSAELALEPEPEPVLVLVDAEPVLEPEPEPVSAEPVLEPEPVLVDAEPVLEPEPVAPAAPALVPRTFRLPASVGATTVHLVGDVNDWSLTATPLRREGAWFVTTLELEPGRSYRYRYLLDGARWENDWAADAYVPNGFGSDDSLVRA